MLPVRLIGVRDYNVHDDGQRIGRAAPAASAVPATGVAGPSLFSIAGHDLEFDPAIMRNERGARR
jgi:hypothetical protein